MKRLDVFTPGIVDYEEALDIQHELVEKRISGEIADTLILLEHNPVITFGRGGKEDNLIAAADTLKEKNVEIYKIERGGDVTFHGPGQLVGYPIIDLDNRGRDMHKFLRELEEVLINVIKSFDLDARRSEGYTGVWVDESKLAAIGVAVRRWVSFHGFALNIHNELSCFNLINPCGITDKAVGSISSMTKRLIDMGNVIDKVVVEFKNVFGYNEVNVFNNIRG
ncbi:MAG: lipoyl(octanoyl) transferase LipB [candidate division Zixibacteria bacterium]|nr:lipoyl(octanoyl) transferase LipB [candidate division Zixibacteria bacterium]